MFGHAFPLLTVLISLSLPGPKTPSAESAWSDILPAGAQVENVLPATKFQFIEGPVWLKEGRLLFSDIPADTIYQLGRLPNRVKPESDGKDSLDPARASIRSRNTLSPFRKPSHNANGNTLDRQGRVISCEHGSRSVTRREKDGKITTLATHFEGKRLNSPNDAVVKSNGDIYFTDPPYGLANGTEGKELDFNGVYRLAPTGKLTLLVKDFDRPNGLAFSPDEKRLYVNDTERRHIRVFDVQPDGTLANGRVFAEVTGDKPGAPDGMRVDVRGNVYCTGSGGIHVFTPSGKRLGLIEVPEVAANCGWGDPDGKTLYITANTGLYRIRLKIAGVRP